VRKYESQWAGAQKLLLAAIPSATSKLVLRVGDPLALRSNMPERTSFWIT
jgi:hypothetical protein